MDDDFPPYARDSDTSFAAAASMEESAATVRAAVLRAIRASCGATCDEMEVRLDLRHQTCSARIWELHHKMGLIVDSGLRRQTRSNRVAVVWVDKLSLEDPMRIFVTGCSKAVPLSQNTAEGYITSSAARQACDQLAGKLPVLLIAQTHEQAKAACHGCPKRGPIAPHLAVQVAGNTPPHQAELPLEAQAPQVEVVRRLADGTEVSVTGHAPAAAPAQEPTPAAAQVPTTPDNGARVDPALANAGFERGLRTPPDMPDWLKTMMEAAGVASKVEVPVTGPQPGPDGEYSHEATVFNEQLVPDAPAAPDAVAEPPPPVPVLDRHGLPVQAPSPAAGQAAALDPGAMFDAAMTHPQATPPIKTLLSPDVNTGPSVMGSSTLRAFQICMHSGFYQIMKGIRRRRQTERFDNHGKVKFDPLALGTLVHGVLARFYKGAENPYEFLDAITPHYPNIVEETRRLCTLHFNAYAERDRQILDVRFAELESRYYFKKKRVKSAKKNLSLCVSSRHDLGYRKMRPDEPRLPPGVAASGITIMDHKTIGNMTQDAQTAYRHDPQIFTNAVTYERGNSVEPDGTVGAPSAERFGSLTHFGINLIGKAVHHDPTKHLVRLTQIIPRDLLDGYVDDIQHWLYTELADRMFHPAAQDDETWPKSYLCRDPSTGRPCAYVELCERGGLKRIDPTINYAVNEPYDPARLIRPEAKKTGRKPKAKAAADVESK